jgi:hypothetical protein
MVGGSTGHLPKGIFQPWGSDDDQANPQHEWAMLDRHLLGGILGDRFPWGVGFGTAE